MPCQCQAATLRAHRELRKAGEDEGRAYEVAVRIFRHYHPDSARLDAYQTVADWLDLDEAEIFTTQ